MYIYSPIMDLGPQSHNRDGLLIPNSIMVVYMEPLGNLVGWRFLGSFVKVFCRGLDKDQALGYYRILIS